MIAVDLWIISHKPYLRDKQYQSITPVVELVLLHIVLQKPGIYLHEIRKELAEATGVDKFVSTWRVMAELSIDTQDDLVP